MLRTTLTIAIAVTAVPMGRGAWASPRDRAVLPTVDEATARRHQQRGAELFRDGRYEQALHEFEAGFRAAAQPAFLVNVAACERRLGRIEDARRAYRRFLELASTSPWRSEVEAALMALPPPPEPPRPVRVDPTPPAPAALPMLVSAPVSPAPPVVRPWMWAAAGTAITTFALIVLVSRGGDASGAVAEGSLGAVHR